MCRKQWASSRICAVIVAGALAFAPIPTTGQQDPQTEKQKEVLSTLAATGSLWRDRGDLSSLNLFYGPGSAELQPVGPFKFVKESMDGASPKFIVEDPQGVQWIAKMGDEAQSETAASRLVWAAGYFTDEDYYLPELRVEGMRKLVRGKEFVIADGVVRGVRLEPMRDGRTRISKWTWSDNPFEGTRELNGLRVMMAIINNWDLKSSNNSVYKEKDGTLQYSVADLGASFGKTGGPGSRTKSRLEDYAESKFIDVVDADEVDLKIKSRPFFLFVVDPYHYHKLTSREKVARDIPRADAKWLGDMLGRLSIEQIRDCFRAAGYSIAEVEGFANVVAMRIAALQQLD